MVWLTWEYIRKRESCGASTASLSFEMLASRSGRVAVLLASSFSIAILISSTKERSRKVDGEGAMLFKRSSVVG